MRKFVISILVTIGVITTIISSCNNIISQSNQDKNECRDIINRFTQACNSYNANDAMNCLELGTVYTLATDVKAKKFSDKKEENVYAFNKIIKNVFDSEFNMIYEDLPKMKIDIKKLKTTKKGMEAEEKVSYHNLTKKAKISLVTQNLTMTNFNYSWQIDKIVLN